MHFNGSFHCKPSILGIPHFQKSPHDFWANVPFHRSVWFPVCPVRCRLDDPPSSLMTFPANETSIYRGFSMSRGGYSFMVCKPLESFPSRCLNQWQNPWWNGTGSVLGPRCCYSVVCEYQNVTSNRRTWELLGKPCDLWTRTGEIMEKSWFMWLRILMYHFGNSISQIESSLARIRDCSCGWHQRSRPRLQSNRMAVSQSWVLQVSTVDSVQFCIHTLYP